MAAVDVVLNEACCTAASASFAQLGVAPKCIQYLGAAREHWGSAFSLWSASRALPPNKYLSTLADQETSAPESYPVNTHHFAQSKTLRLAVLDWRIFHWRRSILETYHHCLIALFVSGWNRAVLVVYCDQSGCFLVWGPHVELDAGGRVPLPDKSAWTATICRPLPLAWATNRSLESDQKRAPSRYKLSRRASRHQTLWQCKGGSNEPEAGLHQTARVCPKHY